MSRISPRSPLSTWRSSRRTSPAEWGPTVWIVARFLYLPLYLFNVIYVRTIAWAIALIGLLMMLIRLALG